MGGDPKAKSSKMNRNATKLNRFLKVTSVFTKYGFENILASQSIKKWIPKKFLKHNEKIERHLSYSVYERIRMALEELGPSYVKLGQLFSDREDLLPKELTTELKKLQSNVEPQTLDVSKKIEEELGIIQQEHFSWIEEHPFASASIAQVFRAELIDGTKVAVKIKREQIAQIIEADLLIMKDVAKILEDQNEEIKKFNPVQMVSIFERSIHLELSFLHERENIDRFSRNFAEDPRIYCHKVFNELSNNNILCMEFVDGISVTDIEGLAQLGVNPKTVAQIGFDLYMKQVLGDGYFHADPHPGNILVTNEGKLAFIDFGNMGTLMPSDKEHLEDFVRYLVQRNAKGIITTLKKMTLHRSIGNERELQRDIYRIFEIIDQDSIGKINISSIVGELKSIFRKNVLVFPEYVYLLMKGLVQIDGIGRKLDSDLNFYGTLEPYAKKIIKKRMSPLHRIREGVKNIGELSETLTDIPGEVLGLLQQVKDGNLKVSHEIKGLPEMKKAMDRLVLALIISALSIGSAILVLANMPPKIFGVPLLGLLGFTASFLIGLWIVLSMLKRKN